MKKRFRSEVKTTPSPYAGLTPTDQLAKKLDITNSNPTAGNIATRGRCNDCNFLDMCVRGGTECHKTLTENDETAEFIKDLDIIILSKNFLEELVNNLPSWQVL